ncbi:MAG: hypothetical protein OXC08_12130 [Thiotrichales bacterium]|nr:hypothetical protein [Thiotrichales bacterium]
MAVIPTPAALSPWPARTAVESWKAATARLRKELFPKSGTNTSDPYVPDETDLNVARLGGVASARIEQFAPRAPQAIRDEAVIRFAGYLSSRASPMRVFVSGGSTRIEFATSGQARPFVYSGARALLSPFVRRRALPAAESTA